MDNDNKLNLLKEFPPPTYEEWLQVVNEGLKGADFEKVMKTQTPEGITLQPIYRKEDVAKLLLWKVYLVKVLMCEGIILSVF